MNKYFGAIAAAAIVYTAVPAAIGANAIEPLAYVSGFVTAIDQAAGTVTIGGKMYVAKEIVPRNDLRDIQPGAEVEVWFKSDAGALEAAAVQLKRTDKDELVS